MAGDWKNLRRAFKKLDKTGNGLLTLPEFRNVLKLANVVLDEDEVYNVMHVFDEDLSGRSVKCNKRTYVRLSTDVLHTFKIHLVLPYY